MDLTTLTLAQLKDLRIPAATHDLDRWFIRAKEIKLLVGGRGELIAEYLQLHHAEISAHHALFHLNDKYNRKPHPITDDIHLEGPEASGKASVPVL